MVFKEYGFRGAYHNVCIFKLDDKLLEMIKACPDAAKSSHAVCYGYIDAKKGLMLEVLCGGKKSPKYFYFKDLYEGERITIPASDLRDYEFDFFTNLEPRFRKKLNPRIEPLKKYDVPEELEKTRSEELAFLDEFREFQYPDVVRVTFLKNGLQPEEVAVRLTGTGDHCINGVIKKKPKQDFGVARGDAVSFHARETDDQKVEIYLDFGEYLACELTSENLENGRFLKFSIDQFARDQENEKLFYFLMRVLRSSSVVVPCDLKLSDEARAIADQLKNEGKTLDDLSEEQQKTFNAGTQFLPRILTNDTVNFLPTFTDNKEMNGNLQDAAEVHMPFVHAIEMAIESEDDENKIEGIVVNAYSDNFIVRKEMYEAIYKLEPLLEEENEPEHEQQVDQGMQGFSNHEDMALAVLVDKMAPFNYALYLNKINPIQGIRIVNETGDPVKELSLRITSDPEFFTEYRIELPDVPSGKPVSLPDPKLKVDAGQLAAMNDAADTLVTVELCKGEETICGVRGNMQVLAYDQWMGGTGYRFVLPAFVIPTHPVMPMLMHDAAEQLGKWGMDSALDAYQSHNPNRVRELAAAAYAAIQKKNIVYAEPPISFFEAAGQQIRTPETIMEQRLGTCMDMTLLYAGLLEAIGLQTMLVLIEGHIFAGIWLKERSEEELKSSNVVIDDVEQLTMRIDNGTDELTFVECTKMCAGQQVSFADAEMSAKQNNLNSATFKVAIDVFLSRLHGIKPIPPRLKEGTAYQIEATDKDDDELTAAPTDLGITTAELTEVKVKKITNKRELWESKLLDLSTHNMLLNLPLNVTVEPIMSSHIDELEDALSDGHEFNLLQAPDWILDISMTKMDQTGQKSKPVQWLTAEMKETGTFEMTHWPANDDFDINEKLRQEYRNHRLYTFCGTDKQLERELTTIYRAARASQQENGVSSLYLAIGLLRWYSDTSSKEPCYAPLILLPIEIVRKSANQGYALHARQDDPHFNTTLLEMLKQNYNLNIGGVDPLPEDEHGIDIKKVFAIVRNALLTVQGWDVVETCAIGNFSFAQFAMWNDIHTAGEMLEQSKIVRSLMKGHVDWEVSAAENLEAERTYLPITVDATQLQAIKMAAHGTTFVLHGPPGTGKSQTITGMIANLMAQGKKVLFVAEKMAALSVVQRRLSSLGIGDFCLELHSDKANKKQVLSQLDKALAIKHPDHRTEYEEYLKKAVAGRKRLDGYAEHLHRVHPCGYSLRELIDLFETVRDAKHHINFDRDEAGKLTREQIQSHTALISRLIAAGEAVGGIGSHPLAGVGVTSYSADVRGSIRILSREYLDALHDVMSAAADVAAVLGVDMPHNKADLVEMKKLLDLYNIHKGTEPMVRTLLSVDSSTAYAYFNHRAAVEKETLYLLNIWKKEFLSMDMSAFLAKHEAAGKKFFGKAAAMSAVTSEIQKYSRVKITYEQIPAMLPLVTQYQGDVRKLENEYAALPVVIRNMVEHFQTREAYISADNTAKLCKEKAESFPGGLDAIIAIAENPEHEKSFKLFRDCIACMYSEEQKLNTLLERKENQNHDNWFESEIRFCEYLARNASALKDWGLYNQAREECINAGLKPVVDAYEVELEADEIERAYKKGLYYALINFIISSDDVLSCFSGATFNESIQQFKKLDDKMLQQTKQEIYYLLASSVPSAWDSPEIGIELNLLRKAIGSNARGMSIRTLFERIPHVLKALCPCMLMSPNSVAQYLAQDNNLFDVVIFDEASQLPTCKAIGALSRAKDAVIVGDPKQMPPTAFFTGAGPEVDDLALDDLDSILDDALALGIPSQHLQWHYRSTHESLIAFSNNQFYENKMYTFPSANDRERHVTAVHVEGTYVKSTNIKEAEAVVGEIVRRFLDPELKNQSIGVVTFNVKQQTLIENLLAKQFQGNPELDLWANSGEDPLFVKNLENVQGDERDVILFSIGYGPDEKGRISMNFGPINKQGGGKRLNVAFSRARVTMTIFASLYSSDIKVTESSPEGLIAFRDFLKFAEGQDIQTEASEHAEAKLLSAGILQNICKAITEHGYQCETMVGHSDFHVDIAVVDPFEPTRYMIGILLDGDGYRQTKNTRDREIAQIGVLKNLGWTLLRVWTIDWWDNRAKVIRNLLEKLDTLKAEAEKKNEDEKATEEARKAAEAERVAEAESLRAELESQAAEVISEDEEAEKQALNSAAEAEVAEAAGTESRSTDPEAEPAEAVPENHAAKAENQNTELKDQPAESVETEDLSTEQESQTAEAISNAEVPENTQKAAEAEPQQVPADELTSRSEVQTASETQNTDDPLVGLMQKLADSESKIIDKRTNGGALWIVGGKNLSPIMKELDQIGIHFIYKAGGGKATGGKDGWWAKTDVVLPDLSKKVAPAQKPESAPETERTADNPVTKTENVRIENTTVQKSEAAAEGTTAEVTAQTEPEQTAKIAMQEKTQQADETTASRPIEKSEVVPTEYAEANLPVTSISQSEFAAPDNKAEIGNRILAVLAVEAPILKDNLFRRIWSSFGIQKTSSAIEATEKAMKAVKVKTTKQKGIIYCWAAGQDPKEYAGIRISNSRSGDEICQQEIRNAVCYVLKNKGELSKDELIKEVSLVFGYKRLGKNLEAVLAAGVQYAKTSGAIVSAPGGKYAPMPEVPAEVPDETEKISDTVSAEPVTVPIVDKTPVENEILIPDGETALYCDGANYKAAAVQRGTEFVVLKGSKINSVMSASCPASTAKVREKYADAISDDFVISTDISFASPSGAACFVAGSSCNGYTAWRTANGTTLKNSK